MSQSRDPEVILNALRRCRTVEQVNATARLFGNVVQDMEESAIKEQQTRAKHIKELAAVLRTRFAEGWVPPAEGADA